MSSRTFERERDLWRVLLWRVFILGSLLLLLTTAAVPPRARVDFVLSPLIADWRFDWIAWETDALQEELAWRLRGGPVSGDQETHKAEVRVFLERQRQIARLESQIRGEIARLAAPTAPEDSSVLPSSVIALQNELEILYAQQRAMQPRIERILSTQVSRVLAAEGLGRDEHAWPPVTFRFTDPPTWLVISPRDEIRTDRGAFLLPNIPEVERNRLELAIERRLNVSALIVDVGGIGIWPSMIVQTPSLPALLETIAHEWTHTYLFFFKPLGLHYLDSPDLMTMNETIASIVGEEIGGLTLTRYYPELAPPPSPEPPEPAPVATAPSEFHQAMRRIRLRVDALLEDDRVAEAEAYMERERRKLVEKGYYLRRLNQAYFAFHGSYATSPASIDPIGPWLEQLRAQHESLKSFLEQVSQMSSLDDLLEVVE